MAPDNYDVAQAAVRIIPTFDRFDEELDSGIKAAMAQAPTPFVTIGAQVDKAEVAAAKDYIDAAFANPINVNVLATLVQASVIQALSELSAETDNGVKTPIEAYLDTVSVERALEEANEEVEKGVQSPLNFHLQTGSVEKALEEANAEAEKGIQSPLNFHLQTGSVEKSLSEADAEAEKGIQSPLDFHLQTGSVAKALAAAKAGAEKGVTAPLDANLRASSVAQALGEMAADLHRHFTVPIQATTKPLVEEVAAVETTLHSNAVTIPVKANVSEAVATALAAATAAEAATMGGGGGGGSIWAATAGESLGNLIYGVEGRSFLARLLSPLTMISTLFSANFGSLGSLAGFGPEHLLTTLLGLGGLATGGGLGALLLGSGALAKTAVGGGSDSLVSHEMLTNVKALISGTETLTAVIKKVGVTAGVAEDQLAKAWKGMEADFDKATGPAQAEVAGIGEQFVKLATDYIPLIAAAADKNFGIIANGLKPLFAWLEGPQGKGIFENLENEFSTELPTSMHAFDQGMELFLRVVNLASTYTGGLTKHINEWLTRMNGATFGKVRTEVGKLITDFHLVDTFIKTLGKDIVDIFKNDAGTATAILKLMTSALKELGHWINSISGGDQLKRLFTLHKGETLQLMQALGELLVSFGKVYLAVAPDFVKLVTIVLKLANAFFTFTQRIPGVAELVAVGTGLFIMEEHSHTLTSAVRLLGDGFGFLRGSMSLLLHPISTIEGFFSRTFSATHMTTSEKMQSAAASMREAATQMSAAADQMSAAMGQVADSSEVTGQQMSVAMQGASGKTQAAWMEAQIAVERSVDAQRAAMESLGDSDIQLADTFQSVTDRIIASGAEMDERVAAAMAEMDATLGETGARVAAAGTEMGAGMEVGADEVVAGTSIMDGALATLGGLMESLPMLAVFAGLTIGIEELITHWSAVVSFFKANETTILLSLSGLAAGFTALDIVMDANPVGIVIEAIAALGLAIYELYEHWETVYNFLKGPWGYLIAGFVFSFNPLIGIIILVGTHWQAVWGAMKEIVDDSWHAMDASWHEIESGAESLWSAMEGVAHDIESAWDDLVSFFENLPHYFEEAWDAVASFFESIPGKIKRFFEDAGQWLLHVGSDIISGLIHGLEDGAKDIAHVVSDIGHDIVHVFSDILGIFSPSKVMTQQGHTVMAGMTQGIQGGSKETVEAATKAAKAILKAFGTLNKIKSDETTIKTVSALLSSLTTALTKLAAFGDKSKTIDLGQLTTNFQTLTTAIKDVSPLMQKLQTALVGIDPDIALISTILKKLDTVLSHISTAFRTMGKVAKIASITLGSFVSAMHEMPGIIVQIQGPLKALHAALSALGTTTLKSVAHELTSFGTVLNHFKKILSDVAQIAKMSAGTAIPQDFRALQAAAKAIATGLTTTWTEIHSDASTKWTLIEKDFSELPAKLEAPFKTIKTKFKTIGTQIATGLKNGVVSGESKVTKALTTALVTHMYKAGIEWVRGPSLGALGESVDTGIATGVSSHSGALGGAITTALDTMMATARSHIGAKSPALAFAGGVGKPIAQGIGLGLELGTPTALEAARRLLTQLLGMFGAVTLKSAASSMSSLKSLLSGMASALSNLVTLSGKVDTVKFTTLLTNFQTLYTAITRLTPKLAILWTELTHQVTATEITKINKALSPLVTLLNNVTSALAKLEQMSSKVDKIKFTVLVQNFGELVKAITRLTPKLSLLWTELTHQVTATEITEINKALGPFVTLLGHVSSALTKLEQISSKADKINYQFLAHNFTILTIAIKDLVPHLSTLSTELTKTISTSEVTQLNKALTPFVTLLDHVSTALTKLVSISSKADKIDYKTLEANFSSLTTAIKDIIPHLHTLQTELSKGLGTIKVTQISKTLGPLVTLIGNVSSALTKFVTISSKVDQIKYTQIAHNMVELKTAIKALVPALGTIGTLLLKKLGPTEVTQLNKGLNPFLTLIGNLTSALTKLVSMSSSLVTIHFTALKLNLEALITAVKLAIPLIQKLEAMLIKFGLTKLTSGSTALGDLSSLLGSLSSALTAMHTITSTSVTAEDIKNVFTELSNLMTHIKSTLGADKNLTSLVKTMTALDNVFAHFSSVVTAMVTIGAKLGATTPKQLSAVAVAWTLVMKMIVAIPPKLIGAFTTLPTKFHGIGVTMMVGLANGIRAGESSVVNAAAAVVSAAVAAAKTAAIISSPSLLMAMEVGLPMGEGIAVGLLQSSGSVVAASKSLVHSAVVGANPSGALGAGGSGTFQPVVHVHVNGNANMSASDIAAAAQQGVVKGLMQVTAKTKQLGG